MFNETEQISVLHVRKYFRSPYLWSFDMDGLPISQLDVVSEVLLW